MSTSHERIDQSVLHEPARKPYTSPLLTRFGTVEELTQSHRPITADVATGSGISADASEEGPD